MCVSLRGAARVVEKGRPILHIYSGRDETGGEKAASLSKEENIDLIFFSPVVYGTHFVEYVHLADHNPTISTKMSSLKCLWLIHLVFVSHIGKPF